MLKEIVENPWYRFFISGENILGRPLDNATYFHAATLDFSKRPYEKLRGPLIYQQGRRWLSIVIPLWFMVVVQPLAWLARAFKSEPGWWTEVPWYRVSIGWEIAYWIGMAVWGCIRIWHWYIGHTLVDKVMVPVARQVMRINGMPFHRRDVTKIVELPGEYNMAHEYDNEDKEIPMDVQPVIIWLPEGHLCTDPGTQQRLVNAIAPMLGMPNFEYTYFLRASGGKPRLEIKPKVMPPKKVDFDMELEHLLEDPDKPLVGLAAGNEPVYLSYIDDCPHVLISGGSGTGKSVTIRKIFAQRLHAGQVAFILDFKAASHMRWAYGLPNVAYAWDIAQIHHYAVALGDELERRIKEFADTLKKVATGELPADYSISFPIINVLVEEANSLTDMLTDWWQANRQPGQPTKSPAIAALKRIIFMGREMGMHGHYCAQRASASIFGGNGGDVRENFNGSKLLAKWSKRTWAMLADGIAWMRWPGGGRGIWAVLQDDSVKLVRVGKWSDAQCRSWASGGHESPSVTDVVDLSKIYDPDADVVTLIAGETVETPAMTTDESRMTIREMVGAKKIDISLDLARKLASPSFKPKAEIGPFPTAVGEIGKGSAFVYQVDLVQRYVNVYLASIGKLQLSNKPKRPSIVYEIICYRDARKREDDLVLGYIGQTTQTLEERMDQHRVKQPWADLIHSYRAIDSGVWDQDELDSRELAAIWEKRPRYNFHGQEGRPWALAIPAAIAERHARDLAEGRTLWRPFTGDKALIRTNQLVSS